MSATPTACCRSCIDSGRVDCIVWPTLSSVHGNCCYLGCAEHDTLPGLSTFFEVPTALTCPLSTAALFDPRRSTRRFWPVLGVPAALTCPRVPAPHRRPPGGVPGARRGLRHWAGPAGRPAPQCQGRRQVWPCDSPPDLYGARSCTAGSLVSASRTAGLAAHSERRWRQRCRPQSCTVGRTLIDLPGAASQGPRPLLRVASHGCSCNICRKINFRAMHASDQCGSSRDATCRVWKHPIWQTEVRI